MRVHFALIIGFAASIVSAQDNLCNASKAATVDKASGVVVQKVTLSGSWGSNLATVFLPDKEIADGAVLFSHSIIQPDNGASVDLTPLALTLARAGAVVIVPERTMTWPPKDQRTNREGTVPICAARWLTENTKLQNDGKEQTDKDNVVIRWGYGYVGPSVCDPPSTSDCQPTSPFVWSSRHSGVKVDAVYVPLGELGNSGNIEAVMKSGGLGAARFLQRQLSLTKIDQLVASPYPVAQANAR